jgi:hypothetical protein
MPQYARPSADITLGGWSNQAGATASLFASIDEVTADDADFVQSSLTANDAYECRLSTVAAALIRRGHIVRYRGRKNAAAGNTRGVTVELRQGATVIASNTHADLTALMLDGAIVLTPGQAAAITDYTNLRIRFAATGTVSGSGSVRRRVVITWAQVRVPDATFGAIEDTSTPGVWRYTLNGFTGTGATREDALVDLFTQIRDSNPADPVNDRRWTYVYYARKIRDYTAIRAAIVAGTYTDSQHLTQAEKLAIVDAKLAGFDSITAAADSEDGG